MIKAPFDCFSSSIRLGSESEGTLAAIANLAAL
jgi:hypothetical protein